MRTPARKIGSKKDRGAASRAMVKPDSAATQDAPSITAQRREAMIREAAYLRAEGRGFCPGHELEDWLAAEMEIDRMLKNVELPRFCNY